MKKIFSFFAICGMLLSANMMAETSFPGDPGSLVVDLELFAVQVGGETIADYAPIGAGTYNAGDSVTITAQEIPGFKFLYWTDASEEQSRRIGLTQSTSYTAVYEKLMYTIVFQVDGNDIESMQYSYGDTIVEPATPIREATAQYRFEFAGWEPQLPLTVSESATYVAKFDSILQYYRVRFLDWDESVLQSDSLAYGAMPQFTGNEPTREQVEGTVYRFAGWEPEPTAVEEDADYYAQYNDSTIMYTVVVTNGAQQTTSVYAWGTQIELTANTPEGYHFVSWSNGSTDETIMVTITSDTTFTSMFLINRYQITFMNWNDTILQQDSVNYNVVPVFAGKDPTREEVEGVRYTFAGWEPEIVAATADQIYTATFTSEDIEYIISALLIVDGDSLSQTYRGIYGQEISFSFDLANDYHFLGWNDGEMELNRTITITGDASYEGKAAISYVDIAVEGGKWTFICLPMQQDIPSWTEQEFVYDGLNDVAWGTYNGAVRAQAKSGWEVATEFNAQQGYIIYSSTSGRLRLAAWPENLISSELTTDLNMYPAAHEANANWNFVGNPYNAQISASSITVLGPEEATATIWNGEGYDNELLSSQSLIFTPLQAFFIQTEEEGSLIFNAANGGAPRRNAPAQVAENSRIDIHATAGGYTDKSRVIFRSNSSLKYEAGRDASKFMTATAPIQMYFLDIDNVQCAQMVRPAGEDNIRLGYMIRQAGDIEINMPVYAEDYQLYDALTGNYYDLSQAISIYSEAGTYDNRLELRPIHRVVTGVSNTNATSTTTKLFINGQLYLLRDGNLYSIQGQEVK